MVGSEAVLILIFAVSSSVQNAIRLDLLHWLESQRGEGIGEINVSLLG